MKTLLASISVLVLGSAPQLLACVGCREPESDTIANEPETVLAGFGFSWGVIIMLTVALSVVGGISAYIWRTIVRIDRERSLQ